MTFRSEVSRLNAPAQPAVTGPALCCTECGTGFTPGARHAAFCGPVCRGRFNNRRLQRGAELYDLYMAFRYSRPEARRLNLFAALNRLAAVFRADDHANRGGRPSWSAPDLILERHPFLLTRKLER